jgi:RNA polymerase-binding transcription factor DksA
MATKKPAPKKASKVAQPAAKKAAPVKPAAKAKAPAKPVAKPAAKKAAPAKKPVAAKPVAKPVAKPAPKAVAQKPAPKPVAQPAPKAVAKPTATPAAKATAPKAPEKPAQQNNMKPKENKATPPKPVVIPKTTTKTVRKYQPEFTKSILDKPKQDQHSSTLVRYSDSDLTEFKDLIQRKLDTAKKELTYLQGLITRKDEMGGDESDNRYMTMEDGSLSMEREQLSQMASRQITFIDHLEKALMRIENKTYGVCRVTGKLIDKARLRAVPHATLSIEAKMGIVK